MPSRRSNRISAQGTTHPRDTSDWTDWPHGLIKGFWATDDPDQALRDEEKHEYFVERLLSFGKELEKRGVERKAAKARTTNGEALDSYNRKSTQRKHDARGLLNKDVGATARQTHTGPRAVVDNENEARHSTAEQTRFPIDKLHAAPLQRIEKVAAWMATPTSPASNNKRKRVDNDASGSSEQSPKRQRVVSRLPGSGSTTNNQTLSSTQAPSIPSVELSNPQATASWTQDSQNDGKVASPNDAPTLPLAVNGASSKRKRGTRDDGSSDRPPKRRASTQSNSKGGAGSGVIGVLMGMFR